MIKATLGELVEAEQVLTRIASKEGFSFKTVYSLAKLTRLVKTETKFWWDERSKLFEKFGEERDATPEEKKIHGPRIKEITPKNLPDFQRLITELNSTPIEINWNPIKSTDLNGVTAMEILILGPLCELVEPSD